MRHVVRCLRHCSEGNDAFKAGDYEGAVARYSEAIQLCGTEHTFFSNRSMALAALSRWEEAASDGKRCVEINSSFMKGYHRAATALLQLGRAEEAVGICSKGLVHHGGNADLMTLLETCRNADKSAKASAKAGMSRSELLKSEGNVLFKAARFEDAIAKYTKAIDCCESLDSEIAITILNNRAACNQQLSNFSAVVDDTTMVLDSQPSNIKALLRRALAFEGLERYRTALSDVRQVLVQDPRHPVANQLQHRLGQTVRTLKAERPTH